MTQNKKTAFAKFRQLSFAEKRLFIEAVYWTIFYKSLLLLPFRMWIKLLKKPKTLHKDPKSITLTITLIQKAVIRSSKYLPFKQKCLLEALVMKRMLLKRNIDTKLSFGLSKNDKKSLIAHAWLTHEGVIISGGKNVKNFVEIKQF